MKRLAQYILIALLAVIYCQTAHCAQSKQIRTTIETPSAREAHTAHANDGYRLHDMQSTEGPVSHDQFISSAENSHFSFVRPVRLLPTFGPSPHRMGGKLPPGNKFNSLIKHLRPNHAPFLATP